MSKKWITILVAAVIGALLLPSAAMAACVVTVVNSLQYHDATTPAKSSGDPSPYNAGDKIDGLTLAGAAPLIVNKEGVSERVADLLITDDGVAPNCFASGNDLVITYNAIMTKPTTPGNLLIPDNLDIFDSNGIGGLTVTTATVSDVFAANTHNSQLDIKIGQTGTPGSLVGAAPLAGSALRVKNIRLDATKAGATIDATFLGTTYNVGTVTATLTAGSVDQTPTPTGAGTQSSGKGLTTRGQVAMTESFGKAFRTAGGTCNTFSTLPVPAGTDTCYSGVANDIATVATSLTFSVTGIPSGVTVTFPSTMNDSVANGADALAFAARSATLTNTGAPGALTVTYDTKNDTVGVNNSLTIETADNYDSGSAQTLGVNPNCKDDGAGNPIDLNTGSRCNSNPKIGVKIASTSAAGTAKLWMAFGPADVGASLFTGDDVATDTTVIPRYKTSGRGLVNGKSFFVIGPTRTTLLFPFVSTRGGWNSGIEVANTGNDAGVFSAAGTGGQLGGITLFFFGDNPNTGAVVTDSVNSDLTATGSVNLSSACIGLDSNGRVAAGQTAACNIVNLLPLLPTKPTGFEGYVIAVSGFNFAHGFSVVFNASGAPFAAQNALVLGLNGATARVGTEGLSQ